MIISPRKSSRFGIISAVKIYPVITVSVLASILLTGCFSFEKSTLSDGQSQAVRLPNGEAASEHVVVSNFGWYFFNRYPIVCGNATVNKRWPWVFFRNDVTENVLQARLMDYAMARECDIMELNIFNNEEALMTIGVGGLSIPLPYIITFRELQYSGVLVQREKEKQGPATPKERLHKEMNKLNSEMKNLLDKIPDGGAQ